MATATLTTLPLEILYLILDYVLGIDIENLAKTFNHALTSICVSHPLVQARIERGKLKHQVAELMPPIKYPYGYSPKDAYELLELKEEWGPFVEVENRKGRLVLDYLDFDVDGGLEWYKKGAKPRDKKELENQYQFEDVERLKKYEEQAKACGFVCECRELDIILLSWNLDCVLVMLLCCTAWSHLKMNRLCLEFVVSHEMAVNSIANVCPSSVPQNLQTLLLERQTCRDIMFGITTNPYAGLDLDLPNNFVKIRWLKKSALTFNIDDLPNVKDPDVKRKLARQCEIDNEPEEFAEGYLLDFAMGGPDLDYFLFIDASDKTGRSRCCVMHNTFNPCNDPGWEFTISDGEEEQEIESWHPTVGVALTKPTHYDREIPKDQVLFIEGDYIQISVTNEMAEANVWPADIGGSKVIDPVAYSLDDFLAAQWFMNMGAAIEYLGLSTRKGEIVPPECPADCMVFRQHLIDIYSTKGRKKSWIPKFER